MTCTSLILQSNLTVKQCKVSSLIFSSGNFILHCVYLVCFKYFFRWLLRKENYTTQGASLLGTGIIIHLDCISWHLKKIQITFQILTWAKSQLSHLMRHWQIHNLNDICHTEVETIINNFHFIRSTTMKCQQL